VDLNKTSSIKKCPKCGGSTEIFADYIFDFHPDSGGLVQEIKLKVYKCKKCGNPFSDEMVLTETGKLGNMRVRLKQ